MMTLLLSGNASGFSPTSMIDSSRPMTPELSKLRGYARYALYFAPPTDHPLGAFGPHWMGWDAEAGAALPRPRIDGLDVAEITAITERPARYGFHATLKAPFTMAGGYSLMDLDRSVTALARSLCPVRLPALRLDSMGQFVTLRPVGPTHALDNLANRCVVVLDRLRGALPVEDRKRRIAAGLSPRQRQLLDHWGYPYVLDEFRFHFTLTQPLDRTRAARVTDALAPALAGPCAAALTITDLALFGDPGPERPFRLLKRYPLGRPDLVAAS